LPLPSLPLDTLVYVQSFLDPHDILNLHRISFLSLSTVWINAVRQIALQYNVLPSTFPLENTSLATLEHIATSPSRFLSRLEWEVRAGHKKLPPFATQTI
ncbi:hypothetical protein JAAARDRAFT_100797, partial [Jaapia argillacea MUCL 33604]